MGAIANQFSSVMNEHFCHLGVSVLAGVCQPCAFGKCLGVHTGTCVHSSHGDLHGHPMNHDHPPSMSADGHPMNHDHPPSMSADH